MASSSSSHPWKHDVFLSFRGGDTRTGFTNHLYNALRKHDFETFMDDRELRKGDRIATLLQAIQDSRITVVICSVNYGESRWCLDELVQIFQCQKSNQQIVIPVFYKVSRNDVRHRTGTFGTVFNENKRHAKKIPQWCAALDLLADSPGWVYPDGNKYEYQIILEIVEEVSSYYPYKNKNAGGKQISNIDYENSLWRHDVYLCTHRDEKGKCAPSGFTQNLYEALQKAGIKTFMDYYKLGRGNKFSDLMYNTITSANNFVVVLSEEFAASTWALNELDMILEYRENQRVIPIFHNVEPEDVRHQTGPFGKEFQKATYGPEKDSIPGWKVALTRTSNMTGWSCKGRLQGEVIDDIVKYIRGKRNRRMSDPLKYFKTLCPPAGENKVVLYTIMFSEGMQQAKTDSNKVRKVMERFGVRYTERDISGFRQSRHHKTELLELMKGNLEEEEELAPRLFIKGKYIGGVKEVFELLSCGKLEDIFDGLPKKDGATVCERCGEVIPDCRACDGSRERLEWNGEVMFPYRCVYCAGTGLERCYTCG